MARGLSDLQQRILEQLGSAMDVDAHFIEMRGFGDFEQFGWRTAYELRRDLFGHELDSLKVRGDRVVFHKSLRALVARELVLSYPLPPDAPEIMTFRRDMHSRTELTKPLTIYRAKACSERHKQIFRTGHADTNGN